MRFVFQLGAIVGVVLTLASPALPAADAAPEDVLSSKGLSKFGQSYVLDADAKLGDLLHVVQTEDRKFRDAKRRHAELLNEVNEANNLLQNLMAQNDQQTNILNHISKSADGTYNHQVDIVNAIRKKARQCADILDQRQKEFAADPEPSDATYVEKVVELSNTVEKANREYEALAADPAVKSAIESLNQIVHPAVKLGPSPRFVDQLPIIRRMRDKVAPLGVRFDMIGGVPEVPVTINDAVKEDMILENSAPYMCITQATAEKLGLQPGASKQTVRLINSEGQASEAVLVTLKSVQLGDFTVSNIPCAIEPESMTGAKNILGKSILKHFIYRVDLPNGMLHLTPTNASTATSP